MALARRRRAGHDERLGQNAARLGTFPPRARYAWDVLGHVPNVPAIGRQLMNDRLRVAMASASVEPESMARKVGVDPKTVQRWLGGRLPHPRHRWKICDILGQSEQYIWPQVLLGASGVLHTSEIVSAYVHRADAPSQLWAGMLEGARRNVDLLGYSISFFPEQHSRLAQSLEDKCGNGLKVRIALADPESAEVAARDDLERLGGTLPTRIRTTMVHFESLFLILALKYVCTMCRCITQSTASMIRC